MLTLDTHLDTPASLARPGWDITRLHRVVEDGTQVDYPRMVAGGLTGGFFAIYTTQGPLTDQGRAKARDFAIRRTVLIREMIAGHSDKFALALTADDAERIGRGNKRIVFLSIENGYPLGKDLSLLEMFYSLGVRMIGPVHVQNNDLGDSSMSDGGPRWHGLSELGKQLVVEANRLGLILDASHASDDVLDQMLEISATPVILSHSNVRSLLDSPRNVDEERLKAVAAKGGVIQLTPVSAFLVPQPLIPQREAARRDLTRRIGASLDASAQDIARFATERSDIDKKYPVPRATLDDFMRQVLYSITLVGIDHVGIGGDMDGGGGVVGLEDVADYGEITKRLRQAGYSMRDIEKLWSGNILRVLRSVELFSRNEGIGRVPANEQRSTP
jgi:membrane dipeptidase